MIVVLADCADCSSASSISSISASLFLLEGFFETTPVDGGFDVAMERDFVLRFDVVTLVTSGCSCVLVAVWSTFLGRPRFLVTVSVAMLSVLMKS